MKDEPDHRFKDRDWHLLHTNQFSEQWQQAHIALLMDIRDELKEIKTLLTSAEYKSLNEE